MGKKSDKIDLFENDEITEKPILRFYFLSYSVAAKGF